MPLIDIFVYVLDELTLNQKIIFSRFMILWVLEIKVYQLRMPQIFVQKCEVIIKYGNITKI